jgi:hypothetical protein
MSLDNPNYYSPLWAVTAYFNPLGSRLKLANYKHFHRSLSEQGIPLLTAECVLETHAAELHASDATLLVTRKSNAPLWQRERLINLAVANLPEHVTTVAILDCDLLFENPSWLREADNLLDTHTAVQGFQHLVRMSEGITSCNGRSLPEGNDDMMRTPSFGFGLTTGMNDFISKGTVPGIRFGAWVFRRSTLTNFNLYENLVLGGFDHVMIHAMFPELDALEVAKTMVSYPMPGIEPWISKVGTTIQGKVSYAPGICYHLFHGQPSQRRYGNRYRNPILESFDPKRDLSVNDDGMLALKNPKSAFARYLWLHFWLRNDDDSLGISIVGRLFRLLESIAFRVYRRRE